MAVNGDAAVFLDRDGTLVEDLPFNVDPALVRFTPFAIQALRLFADSGYEVVIVTNQPGLEMQRFTDAALYRFHDALRERIEQESGVAVRGIYACPHRPDAHGRPVCECRKPRAGLLRRAAAIHRLDLRRSWMIGDILDDVEAGHRAGCRSVLLDVGHETRWELSPQRSPEFRCQNMLEAAQIVAQHRRMPPRRRLAYLRTRRSHP